MNVAAYTRVSTKGQVGEDKYGLESQKKDILSYCELNDMTVVQWFTDEGESGAKERPGFDSIVYGDVANPPIEAVIVAKSDRVARDINIYFYYKYELQKKNIQLISVAEDFGNMGVLAPVLEAMIVCFAQMEREAINKRMSGGRKVKAAKGGYSGGQAPMGYKVEDGRLVINPDEAPTVRRIFELKAEGKGLTAIARTLNEEGHKTRKGMLYQISTVQSIVNNKKTYQGYYKYGPNSTEWVKGEHEAILPVDPTDDFAD